MNSNKKKSGNILTILAVIVIAGLVLFAGNDPLIDLTSKTSPERDTPADVELYRFNSLTNNNSTNVEIWLINTGDKTASNISVFVRAQDKNGAIFFSENISLTILVLRSNETCSGAYAVPCNTTTSTIEISWDSGRNAYQKT